MPPRLIGQETPFGKVPARLRPIFRDETELAASPDLGRSLKAALDNSEALIVVCSPAAAASKWVDREIADFIEAHGRERVLAVICDGAPEDGSCFPPSLLASAGGDLGGQPIAADLRPGHDGDRLAKLKLVAGLLGLPLDEVVGREEQRRQRGLITIAAASAAGMAVMTGLTAFAFLSRHEARVQRNQAEGLIEFMLVDLRKRAEPRGQLDLMDGIGQKALAYYEVQSSAGLDDASLGRRAKALRLMGEIAVQRGDLEGALRSFGQAAKTTAEVLARAPNDGNRIFNHAQDVYWVGNIAWQRGDDAAAEFEFQRYRDMALRLVELDPSKDDWQDEVDNAYSDLGTLLLDEGKSDEALTAFQASLAVAAKLAAKHPGETDRQIDLEQAHAWVADAFEQAGRPDLARAERSLQLGIDKKLLAADASTEPANHSLVVILRAFARFAALTGNVRGARAYSAKAATLAEAMLLRQPNNMSWDSSAAVAEVEDGENLLALHREDEAQRVCDRAEALLRTALAHDKTVLQWRQYQAQADLLRAAILRRRGDAEGAGRLDQSTVEHLTAKPSDLAKSSSRWLLARARLALGDDLHRLGSEREARTQWAAGAGLAPLGQDLREPRLLTVVRDLDQRLGAGAQAREANARLSRAISRLNAASGPAVSA